MEAAANSQTLQRFRYAMAAVIGGVSGVAGVTGWRGFVLYLLLSLLATLALLACVDFRAQEHFRSGAVSVAVDSVVQPIAPFILLWTLAYSLVHIY